jgi:hypothetical protein
MAGEISSDRKIATGILNVHPKTLTRWDEKPPGR